MDLLKYAMDVVRGEMRNVISAVVTLSRKMSRVTEGEEPSVLRRRELKKILYRVHSCLKYNGNPTHQ